MPAQMTNLRKYLKAVRGIAELHRELSGCDWCCGGGDELLASLEKQRKDAETELGGQVPRLCSRCVYFEAAQGPLCTKCASTEPL
jgi:hypothetical protein